MSNEQKLIPNGKFTIQSARTGRHRTFRIHTVKSGKAKGARFVALLVGPDNQRNYQSFAVVSEDWSNILVFRKYRSFAGDRPTEWESYACMLECMLTGKSEEHFEGLGYTIEGSRKCARCNRELTEPESIRIGVGPYCRGLM